MVRQQSITKLFNLVAQNCSWRALMERRQTMTLFPTQKYNPLANPTASPNSRQSHWWVVMFNCLNTCNVGLEAGEDERHEQRVGEQARLRARQSYKKPYKNFAHRNGRLATKQQRNKQSLLSFNLVDNSSKGSTTILVIGRISQHSGRDFFT
jgi:hypothetical protein